MQLTQLFRTRCALIALLGISILYLGGAAVAQNAQGTIVGHVTDSTGAAVAGAKITLTEAAPVYPNRPPRPLRAITR